MARSLKPIDANGNTLSDTQGRSYTWDFENRLVQAVVPGTGTVSFKYDPFGRRIQKSGPNGTTNYLYDGINKGGSNVIEDVDPNGNVLARYTQGPRIDEHFAELRSGTVSYYDQDALGSVTSLNNLAASPANTYTYDAFGKLITSTGTLTNPFLYTGREFDSEVGTYYYRARYYDQTIGRFVSEDPLRFAASNNFFVYTQNRPVNATDPTGLILLYCCRGGFQYLAGYEIGNHCYLYNPSNGQNCGRGNQSGLEDPTSPGTVCHVVPGSDGHENDVMRCCQTENNTHGWGNVWVPWWNDCHTLASNCLIMNHLPAPDWPGRLGCRNCTSTSNRPVIPLL